MESPFVTGRKAAEKMSSRGGGRFVSIKPDTHVTIVALQGLKEGMMTGYMHEFWNVKPMVAFPCIAGMGQDCPGCALGNGATKKSYLPVLTREDGKERLAILPFKTMVREQLYGLEDMVEGGSLKGHVIQIGRTGSGRYDTRYTVSGSGRVMDVSEHDYPDFVEHLGPIERTEILELLEGAGLDIDPALREDDDFLHESDAAEESEDGFGW